MFKESKKTTKKTLASDLFSSQSSSEHSDLLYDAATGEKLPKGSKPDGEKALTRPQIQKIWPHDAKTAEKLEWGTKIDGKKVISYADVINSWPCDTTTGARLPWGTKIDGKNVITNEQRRIYWPHDAKTGEKLAWGSTIDGKTVITANMLYKRWPHDAKTGEKLPWGTETDGEKIVTSRKLIAYWPHDSRNGKRLEWGATGEHVISYRDLNRFRPVDKTSGESLPYGTPLGGNVVTRYVFSQEYVFVGSDKKTYQGENEKEKALFENPGLTFQTKKEIRRKKRRDKYALDKIKKSSMGKASQANLASTSSADDWADIADSLPLDNIARESAQSVFAPTATSQAQTSSEDELILIANSPTLDLELNALLEEIDTNALQSLPKLFIPGYDSMITTDTIIAKHSKRNDSDISALDFLDHPSNR